MKNLYIYLLLVFISTKLDAQTVSTCSPPTATALLEANQIKAQIYNDGILWFDGSNPFYQVDTNSQGDPLNTIFAGGLWLGGLDASGDLKVAAMTYRQDGNDFWPGPIDDATGMTDPTLCGQFDDIYNVYQSTIDAFTAGQTLTADQENEIYNYPGRMNPHMGFTMPDQDIAPFIDVDSDGIYDPDNGDYPDILGDQCMYYIMNDIGNIHVESGGDPLGIEIGVRVFAFSDTLESSTFYEYSITNKSGQDYYDLLFGQWIDPDLGEFADDFVGCDTTRNMGYVYNGDDYDEGTYGFLDEIPIQGIQVVTGPLTTAGSDYSLYSFVSYNNDFTNFGNPEEAQHYYNYMNSQWKNGNPFTFGGNGQDPAGVPTNFVYPGNPADPSAWSECSAVNDPGDRRFILSNGPYTFNNGETLTFLVAAHTAYDVPHPCPDITPLQDIADQARIFFTQNVETSNGPEVLALEETASKFYPSPVKHTLHFSSEMTIDTYAIYNAEGKTLKSGVLKQNNGGIKVSDLSSGVYLLNYVLDNGYSGNHKFIIE